MNKTVEVRTNASSLDEATARLPIGFYTTFSTLAQGTRVLGLQAHLNRLYLPAKELILKPAVDENILRERIAELAKAALPHESRLRLILTRDDGGIFVVIQPFVPLSKDIYEHGAHVVTSEIARSDPRIKGTDFITKSAEQRKWIGSDVFEILLTDNGKILEGMTSNYYGVKYVVASRQAKQPPTGRGLLTCTATNAVRRKCRAGENRPRNEMPILVTAQKGILLGVTRRAVLRLARGQGMSIEYRAPRLHEEFNEAFLTSSSRGVVPIVSINDEKVGEGRVGRTAKQLSAAYEAYVLANAESIR